MGFPLAIRHDKEDCVRPLLPSFAVINAATCDIVKPHSFIFLLISISFKLYCKGRKFRHFYKKTFNKTDILPNIIKFNKYL
nr:MAG TPA: hypothetical protein [Caudoviricetes sp.]